MGLIKYIDVLLQSMLPEFYRGNFFLAKTPVIEFKKLSSKITPMCDLSFIGPASFWLYVSLSLRIFLVIVDTEDTIGLCGERLGLGRQLTILPFSASYYSGDSDSDGTQVQTQRWNTFYPKG